jgi:hypothetical protein
MKHVHHNLIVEWANGAIIEQQICNMGTYKWVEVRHPLWATDVEYRIKPKQDIGYMAIYHDWQNSLFYSSILGARTARDEKPICIIKLTKEDHIPVTVEIIKE